MTDIIKALQDTPIPVLLILGGLFFILLGFTTKIGGVIEVSPEQKKWTIPIGLLTLAIGLVINSTPKPPIIVPQLGTNTEVADLIDSRTEQNYWDKLHKVAQVWDVTNAKKYLIELGKSKDPCTAKFAKVFEDELKNKGEEGFKNINNIKRSINQESKCELPIIDFDFSH